MAVRLISPSMKRRTPLRCGVWPGDVWQLGAHRFTVGMAPGDLEVAEVVLRAYGLYTGQHAALVERGGVSADHGAAAQLTYEAGYESAASFFGLPAARAKRIRQHIVAGLGQAVMVERMGGQAGQEAGHADQTPQA